MSDQSIGQALEHDHRVIDEQFAVFARSLDPSNGTAAPDATALATGVRALQHHIYVEEQFHFPPLRAGGLMGPILVMLREHGELWDLLEELRAQVAAAAPRDQVWQTWLQTAGLLQAHNLKEEQIVYPAGDQVLDPEASTEALDALISGETPEGWVCQMSRAATNPRMEP